MIRMKRHYDSYSNNIKKECKGTVSEEENEEDDILVKILEESLIVNNNNKDNVYKNLIQLFFINDNVIIYKIN